MKKYFFEDLGIRDFLGRSDNVAEFSTSGTDAVNIAELMVHISELTTPQNREQ